MRCERVFEIEDGYLLGKLAKEDMSQVEQHLNKCLSCRQRIKGYEELLGQMFEAVVPVNPPIELRTAILAHANGDSKPEKNQKKQWNWNFFPGYSPVFGSVVAAFMLILAALSALLFTQVQDLNKHMEQSQRLQALTSSPDTMIWSMTQPNVPYNSNAPRARMYARPSMDIYLVTAINIVPAPDGKIYKFWYDIGDTLEFGGNLNIDESGTASILINDQNKDALNITSCFITLENFNAALNAPTTAPLLIWKKS
ncbi:MAG: anti-sigma factor [Chloroflexi bacterium]|uniref:Regulator of SigK n=1 Tax=Candidatus Chlorohelix allophototropha TaxID=3003348 RepID=A0A8T7M3C5_9CHLR|nr:anti-sigma factor [Chloroflexota bacterium]WJW65766.1 anti-sigma factor [Chloroflexota bacterium L227-S17]